MKKLSKIDKKTIEEKVEKLCLQESFNILLQHNVSFEYDHYDSGVRTFFIKESYDSLKPVTLDMLKDLEKKIKNIRKDYQIGILYELKEYEE